MPKIAKIKVIDNEVWVKIGKAGEFKSGIALWTPEEQEKYRKEAYQCGWDDGVEAASYD